MRKSNGAYEIWSGDNIFRDRPLNLLNIIKKREVKLITEDHYLSRGLKVMVFIHIWRIKSINFLFLNTFLKVEKYL